MTTQMAFRLADREVAFLDSEIAAGRATSRTDALRKSIQEAARQRQFKLDEQRVAAVRAQGEPLYPDLEGIAGHHYPSID
jgi:Arc/MetJ-type ribon-helix-helix transcriptional regulator